MLSPRAAAARKAVKGKSSTSRALPAKPQTTGSMRKGYSSKMSTAQTGKMVVTKHGLAASGSGLGMVDADGQPIVVTRERKMSQSKRELYQRTVDKMRSKSPAPNNQTQTFEF